MPHPLNRLVRARRAVVGSVVLSLAVLAFSASAAFAAQQYQTTASVNLRSGPGTGYSIVGTLPSGATITVVCQQQGGTNVGGNATWDKLDNGAWVSDYYTTSPSFNSYAPGLGPCGGSSQPQPTCYGQSCIGVDPQNNSNCAGANATTVDGTRVYARGGGGSVWLRWSAFCAANWAQADGNTGPKWWVEGAGGPQYQPFGTAYFSKMVDGRSPARVCIQGIWDSNVDCSPWK